MITFREVDPEHDCDFLYYLLEERTKLPNVNISHKKMPTLEEHKAFIHSKPYRYWYIVLVDDEIAGVVYLTRNQEVGIHILDKFQGKRVGQAALEYIHEKEKWQPILANINPKNMRSIQFFEKNGYKIKQLVYEREA